jgi:hypothetical protein
MNIQNMLYGQMAILRKERLAQSSQLMLGELKLKIESIKDREKPIEFDFGMKPAGASSWRGSYCELGLEYSENGGGEASWNSDRIEYESPYGNGYESDTFSIPENPTTQKFLDMLNALTDKEMVGYKGGDFKMHKNVAVYLGNYGSSSVDNYNGEEYATVAPFDVIENENKVIIITGKVDY